jgi:catechol 2,3-dioxygenase-like lactoylglutathione lyase family enzyme
VLNFQGTWILIVTGGGPTKDKPDVTFAAPRDPDRVDHELTIRVPDCRAAYDVLKSRGANFLAPPVDWNGEIRCFFRDPDGHLLEISQLT